MAVEDAAAAAQAAAAAAETEAAADGGPAPEGPAAAAAASAAAAAAAEAALGGTEAAAAVAAATAAAFGDCGVNRRTLTIYALQEFISNLWRSGSLRQRTAAACPIPKLAQTRQLLTHQVKIIKSRRKSLTYFIGYKPMCENFRTSISDEKISVKISEYLRVRAWAVPATAEVAVGAQAAEEGPGPGGGCCIVVYSALELHRNCH